MSRYANNPFLRLLDSYVLWTIDQLDEGTAGQLRTLAPQLAQAYKLEVGSWQELVERLMELPADFPATVRTLYEKQQAKADAANQVLNPLRFAQTLVDVNFNQCPSDADEA